MEALFSAVNAICGKIQIVSNWFWDFPTNLDWYASIPILGNFSLAIILLVGTGIYFTFKLRFVQVRKFKYGLQVLMNSKSTTMGISSLGAFLLSTAMRIGPGNILGVTGAISIGGPGALFWMWISAFFGMATAFVESTMSQIFKEKRGDAYVGGLPFYGRRLLKDAAWAGVALSVLYIIYAFLCFPAQGFNTISAVGAIAGVVTGTTFATNSALYWVSFAVLIVVTAVTSFGGIKKVSKVTDVLVPIMAVVYVLTVVVLVLCNFTRVPWFFAAIFTQAFKPAAVFGGAFGIALSQGIKRGLMSNEAGQGTITMSAAAADAKHPCEQGVIASLGVFLDTIVICTLTGFVVVMAHCWTGADAESWQALDKLPKYTESIAVLTPGTAMNGIVTFLVTLCFCLFAFTCLLGMISFSEIAANRIRKDKICINFVRCIGLFVAAFGILCNIAGLELGNLWAFSDLGNILIVFFNVPIVYVGAKYVFRATRHYKKNDGTPFTSEVIGRNDCAYWDEQAKKAVKNFSGK